MLKRVKRYVYEYSLEIVVISLLFFASVFLFGWIAHEVLRENEAKFDSVAFRLFDELSREGAIYHLMLFFSFLGKPEFLIPFYLLMLGYFFLKKKIHYGISMLIIGSTSTLLLFSLKSIFKRNRPDLPLVQGIDNYSFPSGHALLCFVLCSIFIYFTWKGSRSRTIKIVLTGLLLLIALAIGVSRIALRVHYASDVLAGYCLGFAWSLVSLWIMDKIQLNKGEG